MKKSPEAETQIRKILSSKFNIKEENFSIKIKEIPGGFLSDVYKIEVFDKVIGNLDKAYICKVSRERAFCGLERKEDQVLSYVLSQKINNKANGRKNFSRSYLYLAKEKKIVSLPSITEDDMALQFQDFLEGNIYQDLLMTPKSGLILPGDIETIGHIAKKLAEVHKIKPKFTEDQKREKYSRCLKDVMIHPELSISFIVNNLGESKIFRGKVKADYLKEMLEVIEYYQKYYQRISLIHGDFIPKNILVRDNGDVDFIDYSRFEFGEPGVDVGCLYSYLICMSYYLKNDYYKKLANIFIEKYISETNDLFIKEIAVVYLGFVGLVAMDEKIYPGIATATRMRFLKYILSSLKTKKLLLQD
ncbi:MAG: phosphotransferase [Candidatus Paceibacterota bacterium]